MSRKRQNAFVKILVVKPVVSLVDFPKNLLGLEVKRRTKDIIIELILGVGEERL